MGTSGVRPGRDIRMSQSAARFLPRSLGEARRDLAGPDLVACTVEVDEVYLGEREKNKHADKERKDDDCRGHQ